MFTDGLTAGFGDLHVHLDDGFGDYVAADRLAEALAGGVYGVEACGVVGKQEALALGAVEITAHWEAGAVRSTGDLEFVAGQVDVDAIYFFADLATEDCAGVVAGDFEVVGFAVGVVDDDFESCHGGHCCTWYAEPEGSGQPEVSSSRPRTAGIQPVARTRAPSYLQVHFRST